jgi:A/G-specific adenine glycosylase
VRGIEPYTQGLMDLGATVCLRRQPKCGACPVNESCIALREKLIDEIPAPRPRKALPHRNTVMLVLDRSGALLLERRPAPGIWGGLWCFPELADDEDAAAVSLERYGASVGVAKRLPDVEHGFTHFRLTISPRKLEVTSVVPRAAETDYRWLTIEDAAKTGIPAPVRRIIESLSGS